MSFSADVKNEILSIENEKECCRHAFAYGLMLFSRGFSYYDISLLTENGRIAGLRITLCGIPEPNRSHKWAGSYC